MTLLNFFKRQKKLPEILLVDKPRGITSYDVIRKLKKRYGNLKIGHAGTLDPLATGLLIIGIGNGTKKMSEFLKLSKVYEAHILLGTKTDTGDVGGKILEEQKITFVDEKEVERVFKGMLGDILLKVPVYSAIKQKGIPLYKRARCGEKVIPPEKTMHIKRMDFLGMLQTEGKFVLFAEMEVGSGTYIRSVVEEIGRRLNMLATVKELRRTKIGNFNITDAQTLEEI